MLAAVPLPLPLPVALPQGDGKGVALEERAEDTLLLHETELVPQSEGVKAGVGVPRAQLLADGEAEGEREADGRLLSQAEVEADRWPEALRVAAPAELMKAEEEALALALVQCEALTEPETDCEVPGVTLLQPLSEKNKERDWMELCVALGQAGREEEGPPLCEDEGPAVRLA